jgi:repressor LexA
MSTLTKKQKQILDFIHDFQKDHGYSPSYREIASRFGLSSVATVFQHIKNLEQRGYVTISENEARSIELVESSQSIPENIQQVPELAIDMIPLAGVITAGQPIEAIEEKEMISVPMNITREPGEFFALKVRGESMIEDGIFDGDYVILKKQDAANDGDIVVALIENEYATLKRYYKEKDHIRLQPANSSMEPFRIKGDVKVQGRLMGLIRKYD